MQQQRITFRTLSLIGATIASFAVPAIWSVAAEPPPPTSNAPAVPNAVAKPAAAAAAAPTFSPADLDFFEKQVRPLLAENCFKCHNDKKQKGGLRLDARSLVLKGGDHGPAVNPADPDKSVILRAIGYGDEDMQMPPAGKLPQAKIDILTKWAKSGAPWPAEKDPVAAPAVAEEPADSRDPEKNREYWAYKPPVRWAAPLYKDLTFTQWANKSPIDRFIAQELIKAKLKPNPPADKVALVRRAYYDLLGLPPTPAQVDAFVNDASPDAWPKLVDRLLASPQYGERWGRHWLDLVRYAETNGYERDGAKPQAWRYRDYVIRSFNADKPYDQFLKEQIAGDELDEVTTDSMIATGYYRLGIWDDEPADRPLARYDVLDGIVSTTSSVVLGMSVGCARCHDHKKDPIPQKDYYKLLAFFQDVSDMNGKNTRPVNDAAALVAVEAAAKAQAAAQAELYPKIYAIEQQFLSAAQAKGLAVGKLAGQDLTELTYKFYRDTWETLPDFSAIKPETTGSVAENYLSLAPASRNEAIGLVFEGKLKVPVAGQYTFHLRSSEGIRVSIAGKTVIDRPGKGRWNGDFTADLSAGLLPIRVEYFNSYAKPELSLAWTGADFTRRSLTRAAAEIGNAANGEIPIFSDSRTRPRPEWTYTTSPKPVDGWMKPDFKADGWMKGLAGFGTSVPGGKAKTEWKTSDIYLRKEFNLETLPPALAIDLHHDEDIEIYINGTLVYQAPKFLREYVRVPLGPEAIKALKPGRNVIAAHVRQTGGGQYFDLGLIVVTGGGDIESLIGTRGVEVVGEAKSKEYADLTAKLRAVKAQKPPEPGTEVMCVFETGRGKPTHVLVRGNPESEGELVQPGFPQVLTPPGATPPVLPKASADGKSSGKRRVLAEWLASPQNPATARVMANRVWQYHFGKGLVPTPNDYGKLGEAPTHPLLLDYLATELVAGGWKLKPLHRAIMLSNTYQLSSRASTEGLTADPANNLYWRFNMRRLGAEEVRDSILSVSGKLNPAMGGPSVYPPIPKEVLAGQSVPGAGWGRATPEEAARRSVYVHVKRSLLVPILSAHDQADTDSSCPVRFTTTVPTQALGMINGEFTNEQAKALADRLTKEHAGDAAAQVRQAIRLTTGRVPAEKEVAKDLEFIAKLKASQQLTDSAALRIYCLLSLNANEFVYLD